MPELLIACREYYDLGPSVDRCDRSIKFLETDGHSALAAAAEWPCLFML